MAQKPVIHGRDHLPGGADPIGGGDGIKFDTSPQEGGFLEVTTVGGNIDIEAHDGGEIQIESEGGSGGFLALLAVEGTVITNAAEIVNRVEEFGTYRLQTYNGVVDRIRVTEQGFIIFQLGAGLKFEVLNSAGAALLRVTEAGTYHIKSGASWAADL